MVIIMVIISKWWPLSSFDDHGGHGIWHDHHFQKDDHGHHVFELLYDTLCMKTTHAQNQDDDLWSSFSGWWPWLQCLNDHGKIEDDIISWWPQQMMTRMMTIVKKCANLKKNADKTRNWKRNPVTRPSGNPTTAHSTAVSRFYNAKKKRSLWLCLPEYLKG